MAQKITPRLPRGTDFQPEKKEGREEKRLGDCQVKFPRPYSLTIDQGSHREPMVYSRACFSKNVSISRSTGAASPRIQLSAPMISI